MAFQAHTSDRLRPLDILVLGPMKQFANSKTNAITSEQQRLNLNQVYMSDFDVLASIEYVVDVSASLQNIKSGFYPQWFVATTTHHRLPKWYA